MNPVDEKVDLEASASRNPDRMQERTDAAEAEASEINMTTREALRFYWKACCWSVLASTVLIMEGFDGIGGNFQVLQVWLQKYGKWSDDLDRYYIPADWQMGLSQATSVGCLLGVLLGAWQVDRFGYRWSMISNLTLLSGFIGLQVFSPNVEVLLVGNLMTGFMFGAMMCLSTAYASEVCPIQLRGYLTSYCNMCWVIGGLIAAGVINGWTNYHQDEVKGYLLAWCLQWIWPPIIIGGMLFAPESPWWLVRKGRLEEAEKMVRRLQAYDKDDLARKTVAMMVRTNQLEQEMAGGTSFVQCFKGTDRRRTIIACMAYACQMLCGCMLSWSTVFFFVQAGMSNSAAFALGLGQSGIGFIGTCVGWIFIRYFGRRTIYLWGMSWMTILLMCIGICGILVKKGIQSALWGQAACLLTWVLIYDVSVGPLAFTVIAESSSTRLRNKTISLARFTYNFISLIGGLLNPYMINEAAWNWGGLTGFYWAFFSFCATIWCFFCLPEFKNRSFRELDVLFERRIPARKFKDTVVDFDADEEIIQAKESKRGVTHVEYAN